MKLNKAFAFLLIMLAVASCKVGPDYQQPVFQLPDTYRFGQTQPDSVLNLAWWELFQDKMLDSLVRIALNENKSIQTAVARIDESRALVGFNKSYMGPAIGYDGSFTNTNFSYNPDASNNGYNQVYAAAPMLSWELDFWGKYRRATEAAKADLLASEYSLRTVQIGLIAEVASTYFLLLDYDQRLQTARQTLQSREEYLDIIQQRFDKGIIPELELNQAQIQKAIAASAVPLYERMVIITENALSVLLGRYPGPVERPAGLNDQPIPPDIPSGIPSLILERRPDVLYAEQQLAAQTARIGVAQAARFPTISLTGMLGIASNELAGMTLGNAGFWSAGAGLMGPIFFWGQNKRRVEVERARAEQVLRSYEQTVLQSLRDVEDALVEISSIKQQLDAIDYQLAAARNANTLSKERYDGGVTSYLEVLDSERTLFDTELNRSETYQSLLNAYVGLYKALGGGWLTPEEKTLQENTRP